MLILWTRPGADAALSVEGGANTIARAPTYNCAKFSKKKKTKTKLAEVEKILVRWEAPLLGSATDDIGNENTLMLLSKTIDKSSESDVS